MNDESNKPDVVGRARWLTELEAALERCERLSAQLREQKCRDADLADLCAEIGAARIEIDHLRRARPRGYAQPVAGRVIGRLPYWRGNLVR